jgi:hypothetical protein
VKDSTLGSSDQDIQDVSDMSFKLLMNNTDPDGRHHTASYDAYLRDPSLNEEICRLFCNDFALYAKACSSPLLSGRQKTQYVCNQERLRVLSVCGSGYDFFVKYKADDHYVKEAREMTATTPYYSTKTRARNLQK